VPIGQIAFHIGLRLKCITKFHLNVIPDQLGVPTDHSSSNSPIRNTTGQRQKICIYYLTILESQYIRLEIFDATPTKSAQVI
jgi:hypothetical protein